MVALPYRDRGLKRAHRDEGEPQITVRLPPDVARALRRKAAEDETSMASVIVAALDAAGVTEAPHRERAKKQARKGGE